MGSSRTRSHSRSHTSMAISRSRSRSRTRFSRTSYDIKARRDLLKNCLLVLNFLLVIGGQVFLFFGTWGLVTHIYIEEDLGQGGIYVVSILYIIFGLIITGLAIFGCCATIRHNRRALFVYIIVLFVLLVMMFAFGVAGCAANNKINRHFKDEMIDTMTRYDKDGEIRRAWVRMQTQYKCCGVNSYEDWNNKLENGKVPPSCCCTKIGVSLNSNEGPCVNDPTSKNTYMEGCYARDNLEMDEVILGSGVFCLILAIIMAIALVLAMLQYRKYSTR